MMIVFSSFESLALFEKLNEPKIVTARSMMIPLGDVERHPAERVDRLAAQDVVLVEVANTGGESGHERAAWSGVRIKNGERSRRRRTFA